MRYNKLHLALTKVIFSIFCCVSAFGAYAVTSIGTTQLLYKDTLAIKSILDKIAINKSVTNLQKFQLNNKIMQSIARQMPGFQNLLNTALIESGNFTVFNAESELEVWKSKDPGFLRLVYKTTDVEPPVVKPESKSFARNPKVISPNLQSGKLILIGWIENITDQKSKDIIFDTNKISFIFSVDIHTEYRLINTATNKVVAAFTAVGHGGMARILPKMNETINYDVDTMVSDMLYSLSRNIRHGLSLKQQQFIKEEIQLENITKKSATEKY